MRDAQYLPLKYSSGRFFFVIKCPYLRKIKVLQGPSLLDFHSFYEFLTLKFVLLNEGESNQKHLLVKTYEWLQSQKKLHTPV